MEYYIEVSLNPEKVNAENLRYFWCIVGVQDEIRHNCGFGWAESPEKAFQEAKAFSTTLEENQIQSSEKDVTDFAKGQWDMFEIITNIYFGKQYYFLQSDNKSVYSRHSGKHMSVSDAYTEFTNFLKREEG